MSSLKRIFLSVSHISQTLLLTAIFVITTAAPSEAAMMRGDISYWSANPNYPTKPTEINATVYFDTLSFIDDPACGVVTDCYQTTSVDMNFKVTTQWGDSNTNVSYDGSRFKVNLNPDGSIHGLAGYLPDGSWASNPIDMTGQGFTSSGAYIGGTWYGAFDMSKVQSSSVQLSLIDWPNINVASLPNNTILSVSSTIAEAVVPVPAALPLFVSGLLGLFTVRVFSRRRVKR